MRVGGAEVSFPSRVYRDAILASWLTIVGDAAVPGQGPVTTSDIATIHLTDRSEDQANIQNRRDVMVHNYTYHKVIDSTALNFVHTCQYQFRLPYLPSPANPERWGISTYYS